MAPRDVNQGKKEFRQASNGAPLSLRTGEGAARLAMRTARRQIAALVGLPLSYEVFNEPPSPVVSSVRGLPADRWFRAPVGIGYPPQFRAVLCWG